MGTIEPDQKVLLDIYRRAKLAHESDEKFRTMISAGQLQIFYYSPRGQEIVSAAMMAALNTDDYLVTTYRGVHDQLSKGINCRQLWAEYAGRKAGTCKGKGGPMHITHPESGVMVTTGIVGSGMPIANGIALTSQIEGNGRVTVVCFGDAATNIGAFHESLNMAQLWKLPVIFLCQNNLYGEHTAQAVSTACAELIDRAPGYGIKAVQVNGNDAFAMYAAAREAVERARAGEGPTFIEAKTFRFFGHHFGDDSHYIPREEMAAAMAADPIPLYRQALLDRQIAEAELNAIDEEVRGVVADAAQFALECEFPDVTEVRIDVLEAEIAA